MILPDGAISWSCRASGAFDGIVDFDRVIADPAHRGAIAPAFDSVDHLHPNDAAKGDMRRHRHSQAACAPDRRRDPPAARSNESENEKAGETRENGAGQRVASRRCRPAPEKPLALATGTRANDDQ
jgi:hypothetical protein